MAKYLWKVWLRQNKLTPNPTDYVAEVDTAGKTRSLDDIVEQMNAEGSEINPATMKAILVRANDVKRDYVLRGYPFFDEFIHITPRVTGAWSGKETYTEGTHGKTVDALLAKNLREDLDKQVGVHVLGVAGTGADIRLVTDVATGKTDGAITPGDDIVIVGDKIKVAGLPQPDNSTEPGIGVFFVTGGGDALPAVRISENTPSKLIVRVPSSFMPEYRYTLRIVTRYTHGSGVLLNDPRIIDYNVPLFVPA
jgi:hypothetical protein